MSLCCIILPAWKQPGRKWPQEPPGARTAARWKRLSDTSRRRRWTSGCPSGSRWPYTWGGKEVHQWSNLRTISGTCISTWKISGWVWSEKTDRKRLKIWIWCFLFGTRQTTKHWVFFRTSGTFCHLRLKQQPLALALAFSSSVYVPSSTRTFQQFTYIEQMLKRSWGFPSGSYGHLYFFTEVERTIVEHVVQVSWNIRKDNRSYRCSSSNNFLKQFSSFSFFWTDFPPKSRTLITEIHSNEMHPQHTRRKKCAWTFWNSLNVFGFDLWVWLFLTSETACIQDSLGEDFYFLTLNSVGIWGWSVSASEKYKWVYFYFKTINSCWLIKILAPWLNLWWYLLILRVKCGKSSLKDSWDVWQAESSISK